MNMVWLQDFVAVAKNGSFSIAAEKLYSSQANVSKHIQLLEREIGLSLFDRSTRAIRITPVGEALLRSAEAIIREYGTFSDTVSQYQSKDISLLKIVTVPIMHMYDLQHFVVDFQKEHPNIQLEITESDMSSVVKALSEVPSAVGIIRECSIRFLPAQAKWRFYPFAADEVGLLCSIRSPFASAERIRITECLNQSLVVLDSGYDEYRILLEKMQIPIELYHPRMRFSSYSALMDCVANGYGVSILTKGLARNSIMRNLPDVVWRPFVEDCSFPLVIALRESAVTPITSELIRALTDTANRHGG